MSDLSLPEQQSPPPLVERLQSRVWAVVWIGLALLLAGMMMPHQSVSLGFLISASSLFTMALIMLAMSRRYHRSGQFFHRSIEAFLQNDALATFFTGPDNEIHFANKAALAQYPGQPALTLILGQDSADPLSLIFRLQNRARLVRHAFEDVVTETGFLRVNTTYVPRQGFIWRLERNTEGAGGGGIPTAIPLIIAKDNGTILTQNEAAFRLFGRKAAHLDRIFPDLPLRTNTPHRVTTANGNEIMRIVELGREAGRREIALLPYQARGGFSGTTLDGFDDLPVAVMRVNAQGAILHANRQARGLLALSGEDMPGLPTLLKGLGRPVSEWLAAAANGQGLARTEIVQAARKDREVYLQIRLNRVVEDGEATLIVVLSDATELKTLEAQFVQSQKMQAIGQLAGGVAHDFNNLLTAISGYCDLLLLRHDEGDPDYGDLVQINQNANRAAALVSQLLAFSRKQNLRPETLDLHEGLSELSHLLNRLLGEKVALNLLMADDLQKVRADRRQLEQVLMNLVVNARDAMPQGGDVTIEAENLNLDSTLHRDRANVAPGEYVSIKVIDQGAGIARDRLGKIFEPFYTTKKTGEGTGLGLSMVYGIVKQTGGFVFVDTVPGQGTSFQVLLPVDKTPDSPKSAPPPAENRQETRREDGVVLLVEDEAPVRAFATRALRMRGYNVIEAGNAEEALNLLKDPALEIDVFVSDVIMPGKDGPTWVQEALIERPNVKVVFMSGYAEESINENQANVPGATFLPKPFSLRELTDTVREKLSG